MLVLALGLAGGTARADPVRYERIVDCAAYHWFAVAMLKRDPGADRADIKAEIKAHEQQTKSLLELSTMLIEPHVSPARARGDIQRQYLAIVDELRQGASPQQIAREHQAICADLSGGG